MSCGRLLALILTIAMTGCAGFFYDEPAVKVYPRPARETLIAVNLALRDLNFFPSDVVPTHSNPIPNYVSTAYREDSLGEIVYVAVRELGPDRSQVEVLTRGDITGSWTWSTWWPPVIFDQTSRRLSTTTRFPQPPPSRPQPPRPTLLN